MRDINKTAVMELIRSEGPVSRSHIASALNLSLTSVVRIIDELMEQNFICATGETEFTGGRRRPLIRLNGEDNLCISIDLGGTKILAVLMDLRGNILYEKEIAEHGLMGDDVYRAICDVIRELMEQAERTTKKLIGISLGIPAYIDEGGSVARNAPSLGWKQYPLLKRLKEDFTCEVVIENDLNLAALGETWFGEGQNISSFAVISVGTGLGAGIVLNHAVYTGTHNMAGEIGYSILDKGFLKKSFPDFGPLESIASGSGIANSARELLRKKMDSATLSKITAKYVFDACREGADWARGIVNEFADYLSMIITTTCAVIDPEAVILGGGIIRSAGLFMDRVRENLSFSNYSSVPVKLSELSRHATVLGATIRLYHKLFNFCAIRNWA